MATVTLSAPAVATPDTCLNMFNPDVNLYNYAVGGDSCFYSVGVHATVRFQGDQHWAVDTGGDGAAHVLAAVWLRSQWQSKWGSPYNYGAEVGWYDGASWNGAIYPPNGCTNNCTRFEGWYEQDINDYALWSTPSPCACEPLNQNHEMYIVYDHNSSCGAWYRALIDSTTIQTPGCQPYSYDAVMAGLEERNSNCHCHSYGNWQDLADASDTVSYSNLQRVDGGNYCSPGCGINQPWGSWGNCATAYVDAIWDLSNPNGWADFTDTGGGYPTIFNAKLERNVYFGGNHPPNHNGLFNSSCGFSAW